MFSSPVSDGISDNYQYQCGGHQEFSPHILTSTFFPCRVEYGAPLASSYKNAQIEWVPHSHWRRKHHPHSLGSCMDGQQDRRCFKASHPHTFSSLDIDLGVRVSCCSSSLSSFVGSVWEDVFECFMSWERNDVFSIITPHIPSLSSRIINKLEMR